MTIQFRAWIWVILLAPAVCCHVATAQAPGEGSAEAVEPVDLQRLIDGARDLLDQVDELPFDDESRTPLLKDIQTKIEALQKASPHHPWVSYLLGRMAVAIGRNADGLTQLESFVKTREGRNEWSAYRHLGDLYVDTYPQLAKGNYLKAIAIQPGEPALLYGLSRCSEQLFDHEDAERYAKQAIEADAGRHIEYVGHLANVYKSQDKLEEAERTALTALEMAKTKAEAEPGQREPLLVIADRLSQLVKLAEARVRENPRDGGRYLRLVRYKRESSANNRKLDELDEVWLLAQAVRNTGPATPIAVLEAYGAALAQVGRNLEAIATFESILQTSPGNAVAQDWLAKLKGDNGG